MALFISLDKRQTAPSSLIPLRRGDDWKLIGKIVEKYARYQADFDLTGCSATGYFEGDPSGVVIAPITIVDPICGNIEIDLPASATPTVIQAENGTSIYGVITHPTKGTITVETEFPVLEIKDRGFVEP